MEIGVIGSGTMGRGIAQVAATSGFKVKIYDNNPKAIVESEKSLNFFLNRLVEKGKITLKEKNNIQSNISFIHHISILSDSNLIIEAIIENLEIKKKLFSELEKHVSDDCIIASNTSSLSIASIASSLVKPDRCIGTHFFNPAPLMKLVEIVPAIQTSKDTLNKSIKVISSWGKMAAIVKDTPGFIVNRVARPFYGESLRIYEEGIASFDTIDWSLKEIGKFRMGPFELMDFIGNDINYTVTETIFKAFYYDSRYKPSLTQKRFVEAGYLGRKSEKGYYNYYKHTHTPSPIKDEKLAKKIFDRVLVMLINEAADALFLNIASAKDIDNAMAKGVNYPKGLLAWADEKGIDWCVSKLDDLYNEYHEDRYRCSPLMRKMKKEQKNFF